MLTCLSARFTQPEVSSWANEDAEAGREQPRRDLLSKLARCGTRCVVVAVMGTLCNRRFETRGRNAQGRFHSHPLPEQKRYGAQTEQ